MTSKQINELQFSENGSVELPKQTDVPSHLELIWDGQRVTSSKDEVSSNFLDKCQDTLKSHSSIVNVISGEVVEAIEKVASPIKLPALCDPYVDKTTQMWDDLTTPRTIVISESSQIELSLQTSKINWKNLDYNEVKLWENILVRTITGPLLEDLASKLNKRVTSAIMEQAYPVEGAASFAEIIRKRSEGKYWFSNQYENRVRSYGIGTKIMLHPLALDFVPAIRNTEGGMPETALGNIPLCLNWDMPVPSDDTAEILIGNFLDFMMLLKPIKLVLEDSGNGSNIQAKIEGLCGLWSTASLGFAKVKIKRKVTS